MGNKVLNSESCFFPELMWLNREKVSKFKEVAPLCYHPDNVGGAPVPAPLQQYTVNTIVTISQSQTWVRIVSGPDLYSATARHPHTPDWYASRQIKSNEIQTSGLSSLQAASNKCLCWTKSTDHMWRLNCSDNVPIPGKWNDIECTVKMTAVL